MNISLSFIQLSDHVLSLSLLSSAPIGKHFRSKLMGIYKKQKWEWENESITDKINSIVRDSNLQTSKVFGRHWDHIGSQFHLYASNVTFSNLYFKKYSWIIFPVASNNRVLWWAVSTSHDSDDFSLIIAMKLGYNRSAECEIVRSIWLVVQVVNATTHSQWSDDLSVCRRNNQYYGTIFLKSLFEG